LSNPKFTKLLGAISFVFIALALGVIATVGPATGYELSIYDAYPICFWLFLAGSICCGVVILVLHALGKEQSNWWLLGLTVLIITDLIIINLYTLRGYPFFDQGDSITHLGHLQDITATGHIGKHNFYPMIHLFGASLQEICGISQTVAASIATSFLYVQYILGVFLLARAVSSSRGQALLITAFAAPLLLPLHRTYLQPSGASFMMLPLLLCCLHLSRDTQPFRVESAILFLVVAFAMVFFYPVIAFWLIAIFLIFTASSFLYSPVVRFRAPEAPASVKTSRRYITVSLITFIVFFSWYFSFASIQQSFREVFEWLIYGTGSTLYNEYMATLTTAKFTVLQTINLFITKFGALALYFLLTPVPMIFILKQSLSRHDKPEEKAFHYSVLLIATLFGGLILLFIHFVQREPIRLLIIPAITALVLNGSVIYTLLARRLQGRIGRESRLSIARKIFTGIIILISLLAILGSSVISIFNFYPSPIVAMANFQITRRDVAGADWWYEHRDPEVSTVYKYRWIDQLMLPKLGVEGMESEAVRVDPQSMPSHFGYDRHSTIAASFNFTDRYLAISKLDRIYPEVYPEDVWRRSPFDEYNTKDFARLNSDSTAAKIYASDELEIWRVYGAQP